MLRTIKETSYRLRVGEVPFLCTRYLQRTDSTHMGAPCKASMDVGWRGLQGWLHFVAQQSHKRLWLFFVFRAHVSWQQQDSGEGFPPRVWTALAIRVATTREGHLFDGLLSGANMLPSQKPPANISCVSCRVSESLTAAGARIKLSPRVRGGNDSPKVLGLLHKVWYLPMNWAPSERVVEDGCWG